MSKVRLLLAVIGLVALALPVAGEDWGDADSAFARGDFDRAMTLTIPLAEAGHVEAQNRLAHLFRYGEGTKIDYERAAYWSQRAADQGSGHAMTVLWSFYKDGLGVAKDEARARTLLEEAAEHGDGLANYNLHAIARRAGDDAAALAYLDRAIALGRSDAQYALGGLHFTGEMGIDQDFSKALHWMELAAGQRHIEAMVFASGLVAHTDFTDQPDYPLSTLYLRAALGEGCLGVGKQLALLLSGLSSKELMQSDQRLADWLADHPAPEPHRHRALPEICEVIVE